MTPEETENIYWCEREIARLKSLMDIDKSVIDGLRTQRDALVAQCKELEAELGYWKTGTTNLLSLRRPTQERKLK